MPFMEYRCPNGHITEVFFKSIKAAEECEVYKCENCGEIAEKVFSIPLGFAFYGDPAGYDKPSLTKRYNTKTVSQKEGNSSAVG